MIAYAAVDGGMYQESGILAAKRDIEELRDRRPAPLRNRKEAKRRNEMGLKLLRENNIVEAFKAFWAGYQADPTDVEIANNLGYAAVLNNDLKTAEQFLIATLLLAPDRGNAWANLGQTYAKQGKTGDAVACFAHAYRFSRDQRKTYQFLRKLAEQDDDARVRSAAAQALQLRLIQLPADNIATAAPLPSPSPPPPSPSSSLTEEIESQLRREGIYNVNVHRVSESTIRLVGTVNSLEEQKRAIAIAQKIVKRTGVLFFIEHEITPGRPRAREKRERDQQAGISPEPSKTRGGIQRGAGRERTELSGPSETTASVPLPSPSEEVSNLTKETDAILKSVSPVSKDAAAAFAAAEVSRLTSLGRRLERLQRLRLETFSRQGLQAHQQKRYREAIEAYETLLTIDPDNFAALFNLAGAYYELNQPDTTIEYAIRAIRRNADPGLYFVVASAYVKKGDKERAFSWLERAIKGGFADRAMIQENFATLQNEPVYRALMQRLS
ncbi:MAG: tetratricopeptide repeat protein [Deltaproteobacteria bacterium]|nr:tetratricopeptide repeat protein [Deltaproteobacteria bacterium]